jgi:hypothetical protein
MQIPEKIRNDPAKHFAYVSDLMKKRLHNIELYTRHRLNLASPVREKLIRNLPYTHKNDFVANTNFSV